MHLNLLNLHTGLTESTMTELIFRFTPEELEVLQSVLEFIDGDIPEDMDEDAYDSLYQKVMSN